MYDKLRQRASHEAYNGELVSNPELEQYLADKVASGLYQTSSEVMRDALRLMRERDALYEERVKQIRRDLAEGFAEVQRGESSPGKEVRARLRARRKGREQAS